MTITIGASSDDVLNGKVACARLDMGADNYDHLIDLHHLVKVAMLRRYHGGVLGEPAWK